jgi:hypothetical protein
MKWVVGVFTGMNEIENSISTGGKDEKKIAIIEVSFGRFAPCYTLWLWL